MNCGYCFPNRANPSCVPGDAQGPYFREDCLNYEYMYPISSLIGKNQGITTFQNFFGIGTYPYYLLNNYFNPLHYIYYNDTEISPTEKHRIQHQEEAKKLDEIIELLKEIQEL